MKSEEANRKWRKENPERYKKFNSYEYRKEYLKSYHRKRNAENPLYGLKNRLYNQLWRALKSRYWKKNSTHGQVFGIGREGLRKHIESQFRDGMAWDNKGEWEIDHITPVSSAKNEDQLRRLFNYKNIRPLWKIDNFNKGKALKNR